MNQATHYERIIIQATLHCMADLHVGSGIEGSHQLQGEKGKKLEPQQHAEVCRDNAGNPYLPASTLRGFLAQSLRSAGNLGSHDRLIGSASDKEEGGCAGKLRVYDARTLQPCTTRMQSRVALEPITGTSKDHQLFTLVLVPAGTPFQLHLEIDKVRSEDAEALLDALASCDGSIKSQIGKGKTLGQGVLKFDYESLQVTGITAEEMVDWLLQDEVIPLPLSSILDKLQWTYPNSAHDLAAIQLNIYPTGPLLVSDPHLSKNIENEPDHEYSRQGNRLQIPASTLKGALRGHCRKIIMTLLHQRDSTPQAFKLQTNVADELIEEIFGGKGQIGRIRVSNATSTQEAIDHIQTFIAVDRFTGGVADGALCMAKAAALIDGDKLPFKVWLDDALSLDANDWVIGLLVLVLRDAMEGDLTLGWGASKGYGAFQFGVALNEKTEIKSWEALLQILQQEYAIIYKKLPSSIEQLHSKIDQRLNEAVDSLTAQGSVL